MDMLNRLYNGRGFIHSPETPQADKEFYYESKEKLLFLREIGESFIRDGRAAEYKDVIPTRIELGVQSKYLHRGVYCPSPVFDILVVNSKRGKILTRPNKRSRITHRYVYDTADKLTYIEEFLDDRVLTTEYLIYCGDTVYGVTLNREGRLRVVSEEIFENNRIQSYTVANFSWINHRNDCSRMNCEKYYYDEIGLLDWDLYLINFGSERIGTKSIIRHKRFHFSRKDGFLESYTRVNYDGTPIQDGWVEEIKLNRKA